MNNFKGIDRESLGKWQTCSSKLQDVPVISAQEQQTQKPKHSSYGINVNRHGVGSVVAVVKPGAQ